MIIFFIWKSKELQLAIHPTTTDSQNSIKPPQKKPLTCNLQVAQFMALSFEVPGQLETRPEHWHPTRLLTASQLSFKEPASPSKSLKKNA